MCDSGAKSCLVISPVSESSRQLVEDLLFDYVAAIDDGRLEEWPDFFVDDCEYKIIPRENTDLGLPAAIIYCDSKGMLRDRVVALRKANIYPVHYCRHLISNTRIISESEGIIHAESSYGVFHTRNDGETTIYNVGKYVDRIVHNEGKLKYLSKHCIFDTHLINTLLVTPI